MKRFFQVLLVAGVLLTLSSAYFLSSNSIYAIFTATLGILLTAFSVFEIVTLKKPAEAAPNPEDATQPIASKARQSPADLEWTYYDVGEKKTPTQQPQEEHKLKFTFFSSILALFGIKSHPKIQGKQIEQELQPETKKLAKEKDKFKQLREYIQDAIKKNIPREQIIEACIEVGWPQEKVEIIFNQVPKKKKNTHLQILYLLVPAAVLLLVGLIITGNFLLGYWLGTIKTASSAAYYAVLLVLVVIAVMVIFDFKDQLKTKRKVYKIRREQKVSDIRTEMANKTNVVILGSEYKTDIDKLLDLVNEKERISVDEVGGIFGIGKEEAEQWGKILKDQGLITLYYPTVGDVELRIKKKAIMEEEE